MEIFQQQRVFFLLIKQKTDCLKNVSPLTYYNLDVHDPIMIVFLQKCYWESKTSNDALFYHLRYI